MDEQEFEIVDNARVALQHFSLERLKTIAPTFRERSAQRLACVELIAEKERELARSQMGSVSRKASLALIVSLVAILWPIIFGVAWFYLQPLLKRPEPVRSSAKPALHSVPQQSPTPELIEPESTPEPLPPLLGEPPPTPRAGAG
jgi:hypothetical protein